MEKDPQLTFGAIFADLEKTLRESDKSKRVEFYTHDEGWKNKLICGDSLQVMESLAHYEKLRGEVQMIYIDPPYGIKFGSNWQVSTGNRDVKDGKLEDTTREVEQIKAFRDTWKDGINSYLAYLRDRLVVARDLLTGSGLRVPGPGDGDGARPAEGDREGPVLQRVYRDAAHGAVRGRAEREFPGGGAGPAGCGRLAGDAGGDVRAGRGAAGPGRGRDHGAVAGLVAPARGRDDVAGVRPAGRRRPGEVVAVGVPGYPRFQLAEAMFSQVRLLLRLT